MDKNLVDNKETDTAHKQDDSSKEISCLLRTDTSQDTQKRGRKRFSTAGLFTVLYALACIMLVFIVPVYIVSEGDNIKIGISPVFNSDSSDSSANGKTAETIIVEPSATGKTNKITLMATGAKNENSSNAEVWITSIVKDDILIELDNIPHSEGWELKSSGLVSYRQQLQPCLLGLDADFESFCLITLTKHNLSGFVAIYVDDVYVKTIDLFEPPESTRHNFKLRFEHSK